MAYLLVADDEQDLARVVAHWLRNEGHEVAIANNGLAALELVRQCCPDLVILDVIMPDLDGLQLCQRLRTDPASALVPILLVTGKGSVEDRVRGLEGGGDDYLVKPFDFRELRARVNALLRRSRLSPALPSCPLVVGPLSLDINTSRLSVRDRTVLLTPIQYKLLCHLMRHSGRVFSARELLRQVWGYPVETADLSLVRWHIKKLRERIEPVPHHPKYIRTVPHHGYILGVPDETADPASHLARGHGAGEGAGVPRTPGSASPTAEPAEILERIYAAVGRVLDNRNTYDFVTLCRRFGTGDALIAEVTAGRTANATQARAMLLVRAIVDAVPASRPVVHALARALADRHGALVSMLRAAFEREDDADEFQRETTDIATGLLTILAP